MKNPVTEPQDLALIKQIDTYIYKILINQNRAIRVSYLKSINIFLVY
jgi:hypothetical protein